MSGNRKQPLSRRLQGRRKIPGKMVRLARLRSQKDRMSTLRSRMMRIRAPIHQSSCRSINEPLQTCRKVILLLEIQTMSATAYTLLPISRLHCTSNMKMTRPVKWM